MSNLNIQFYFLSPIQVVKVTPGNLKEVAEWCGGKVERKESNRVKGRVDSYVAVPTPRNATIAMAFAGMYVTKRLAVGEDNTIKETYSVFRRDYFSKNYFDTPSAASDATWERQVTEAASAAAMQQAIETGHITINISGASNPEEVKARIEEALAKGQVVEQHIEIPNRDLSPETDEEFLARTFDDEPELSPVEQRELITSEAVEAEAAGDNTLDPHRI